MTEPSNVQPSKEAMQRIERIKEHWFSKGNMEFSFSVIQEDILFLLNQLDSRFTAGCEETRKELEQKFKETMASSAVQQITKEALKEQFTAGWVAGREAAATEAEESEFRARSKKYLPPSGVFIAEAIRQLQPPGAGTEKEKS